MSQRTAHSHGGMRRYTQMSRTRVFIFVEGRDLDADVYSRICGPVCATARKKYEIVVADRINGDGGGKNVLTRFFEFLRDNASLLDTSQSEAKVSMFYLDKDIDDIMGRLRRSDYVIYTRDYNLENHLYAQGDLASSVATAGSMDRQLIDSRIPDPAVWRIQAANCWRDWVALCLLAAKLMMPRPASYSLQNSAINFPADSPVDQNRLNTCIAEMEAQSGLPPAAFTTKLTAARRLTDAVFKRSEHDLLFKGKWYGVFVLRELEIVASGNVYNRDGANGRLMGSLIATTNFEAEWVEHFRRPLRKALARL